MFFEETQSSKTWGSPHDLLPIAWLVKIPKCVQRDIWTSSKLHQYESFTELHQWFNSGYYWTFIHRDSKELLELTSGNPANHSMVFKTQTCCILMKPIRHYHTASLAFNASAAASIIIWFMSTRAPIPHSKINLPAFLLLRMFVYLI